MFGEGGGRQCECSEMMCLSIACLSRCRIKTNKSRSTQEEHRYSVGSWKVLKLFCKTCWAKSSKPIDIDNFCFGVDSSPLRSSLFGWCCWSPARSGAFANDSTKCAAGGCAEVFGGWRGGGPWEAKLKSGRVACCGLVVGKLRTNRIDIVKALWDTLS